MMKYMGLMVRAFLCCLCLTVGLQHRLFAAGQPAGYELALRREFGAVALSPAEQETEAALRAQVTALAEAAGVPQPLVILALREQVNAYALPGAVVMTRGMTALITAPAERATLLAHEIGHLVLVHPELAMRRSRHSQYFLQRMRRAARRQDTQEAARLYVQAACSGEIGLAEERAADIWAANLLRSQGYKGTATVWQHLQQAGIHSGANHPEYQERIRIFQP